MESVGVLYVNGLRSGLIVETAVRIRPADQHRAEPRLRAERIDREQEAVALVARDLGLRKPFAHPGLRSTGQNSAPTTRLSLRGAAATKQSGRECAPCTRLLRSARNDSLRGNDMNTEMRCYPPLIMGRRGAVAANHPLAPQAGLLALRPRGNPT